MAMHAKGCVCVLCKEDEARCAEANLFRAVEHVDDDISIIEFDDEPTRIDDLPPPLLAEEWGANEAPTRVATITPDEIAALPTLSETEETTPVAVAIEPERTAKVKSFPELAHLAEQSARSATTAALGAMVDAMIENGIPPSQASAIMGRAVELLTVRSGFVSKDAAS